TLPFRRAYARRGWRSEPSTLVLADGLVASDLADDLELPAGDLDDVHRLDGLVITRADGLLALRRLPFEAAQSLTHLVGLGRLRLLDRGLVGIDQAVGIGAVEIRVGLVGGLDGLDELLVLGGGDFRRVADAGDEAFGGLADGADVLRRQRAGCAEHGE